MAMKLLLIISCTHAHWKKPIVTDRQTSQLHRATACRSLSNRFSPDNHFSDCELISSLAKNVTCVYSLPIYRFTPYGTLDKSRFNYMITSELIM